MKPAIFSPAEQLAADQAFKEHERADCPADCGFCLDLLLSGLPSAPAEMKRIHQLKMAKQQKKPKQQMLSPAISPPKKVGKGKTAPLKGRVRR